MNFCSHCKKEKSGRYCELCKMETSSNYIMKLSTSFFKGIMLAIRMRHKRPGIKKFLREVIAGHKSSGDKLNHPNGITISRVVDKENNLYEEIIIDNKTGVVVRNIKEPLDKHI